MHEQANAEMEKGLALLQTHAGRVDASVKQKALPEVASIKKNSGSKGGVLAGKSKI